ncbi:reverse transcriptase (RNA-dependent DNA polymerase) [Chitinophaga dinghuensis]|uniref:Reverse transcriptase (RNA-dependent DNA polymerase) n=1 Tax=Chitinophaga dinghuensis TaxID=1539050 RepID=A0A327VQG7_9BACT|nr:RNA-directed DNA polymerase [Chitinophaga dinghuensis]RAJ76684.1 reverse transcriptase (RNA-dependent DNA polymerase) [Chitinophaga dinghuensis]
MPGLDDQFLDKENFYLAFKKISFYIRQLNEWYDPILLAEYEATLPKRIHDLIESLKIGQYLPRPIEPLPFPKKSRSNGTKRIRPYYNIHFDDQLVWMALVNIIAEHVENEMPDWNYGNRLYRPVWFENESGTKERKVLKKGSFKNTSRYVYRKWGQSWPLYKRHIALTIKTIAKTSKFKKTDIDDEKELAIFEQAEITGFKGVRYLKKEFWKVGEYPKLVWTGLDFETFFPSIDSQKILENIESCLIREDGTKRDDVTLILQTMRRMLSFPLNITGWNEKDLQNKAFFNLQDFVNYNGIPTGLVVGGFLANAAVIDLDRAVDKYINENREVAVFKYVDDHVVISQSAEALLTFLNFYHNKINELNHTLNFQSSKIEPANAIKYDKNKGFTTNRGYRKYIELDVEFPSPLMTNTLKKVSHINDIDFDLLDEDDIDNLEVDLKHLLITDFPATEIRKDTKMSFASSRLCRLAMEIKPNFNAVDPNYESNKENVYSIYKGLYNNEKNLPKEKEALEVIKSRIREAAAIEFIIQRFSAEVRVVQMRHEAIFKLLLKALKENPDKVKLWKRCIEFCFHTGYPGLEKILDLIKKCEIHPRSIAYLTAYCITNIQVRLEMAFQEIDFDQTLFWKRYCSSEFITNTLNLQIKRYSTPSNNYPFYRQSEINFLSSRKFVVDQLGIFFSSTAAQRLMPFQKKLEGVVYSFSKKKSKVVQDLYSVTLLWYYLSRITWKGRDDFFLKYGNSVDLNSPLAWSILSLSPRLISETKLQEVISFITEINGSKIDYHSEMLNLIKSCGYTYDLFYESKYGDSKIFEKYIHYYATLENIFARNENDFIGLDRWLNNTVAQSDNKYWLDPRLTEWSLLEIIRQIGNLLIQANETHKDVFSGISGKNYHYLHPANYLIPKQWSDISHHNWATWKKLVIDHPITLAPESEFIHDHRYFPITTNWRSTVNIFMGNKEIPSVLGLSILLIKLLSKSFNWPSAANKINFIDQLYSNAYMTIEKEALSSDLRILLDAIFSKVDFGDIFYQHDFIKLGDGSKIKGLQDYVLFLEKIQIRLENAQWNVVNREPRQLKYIDIDDLNKSKTTFFNTL